MVKILSAGRDVTGHGNGRAGREERGIASTAHPYILINVTQTAPQPVAIEGYLGGRDGVVVGRGKDVGQGRAGRVGR